MSLVSCRSKFTRFLNIFIDRTDFSVEISVELEKGFFGRLKPNSILINIPLDHV